jgi:hypothetical protein
VLSSTHAYPLGGLDRITLLDDFVGHKPARHEVAVSVDEFNLEETRKLALILIARLKGGEPTTEVEWLRNLISVTRNLNGLALLLLFFSGAFASPFFSSSCCDTFVFQSYRVISATAKPNTKPTKTSPTAPSIHSARALTRLPLSSPSPASYSIQKGRSP